MQKFWWFSWVMFGGLLLGGEPTCRAEDEVPPLLPNVFDMPRIQGQQVAAYRQAALLMAAGEYAKAEPLLEAAVKRIPHDAVANYNLACALARQKKIDKAFEHLNRAMALGFRDRKHIAEDADLENLRSDKRFVEVLKVAKAPATNPTTNWSFSSGWKHRLTPAEPQEGQVLVTEDCTLYNFTAGLLMVAFHPPKGDPDVPIVKNFGEAGKLLLQWSKEGTAAGNVGDFYDNHDSDHSNMKYAAFPQLTRIEFSEAVKKRGLHHGLQQHVFYNQVTIGNSSTALVRGPQWRCQGRNAITRNKGANILAAHYLRNHLYFYPEHRDHDAGHNGKNGGYGDVLPANTPYLILSQGSSGSDRDFLNAITATLAAFRPEVKTELTKAGLLMPAVQMIFRQSNKQVETPEDYLTGKAHPTVFDGKQLDVVKMVKMAHAIKPDTLPPFCQIEVVEETKNQLGRDYFDYASREKLFDTPCAIARVVKSTKYQSRMVVSAEKSRDLKGKPITYHWKVLRGDADRIQIKPLNKEGSQVELLVPYHTRQPVTKGNPMESNRVDIGAVVSNGDYYSAPAFVSFTYLDNELRTYDKKQRIVAVDYTAESVQGNYVDPLIDLPKNWRDEYHYDAKGQLIGWTRIRKDSREEFTATGELILKRSEEGQIEKTTKVRYVPHRLPNGSAQLKQETVE